MPYRETIAKYSKNSRSQKVLSMRLLDKKVDLTKSRSPANAKGLMQIIPSTGRWILRQLNYKSRTIKKIYNPNINVMMGTFYKTLIQKLDNLIFTLASYNAGVNVSKWSKKYSTRIPEKFIDKYPFMKQEIMLRKYYQIILFMNI